MTVATVVIHTNTETEEITVTESTGMFDEYCTFDETEAQAEADAIATQLTELGFDVRRLKQ